MNPIIAHLIGDYLLQSDWAAIRKTRDNGAALVHCVTYVLPFFFVTQSALALLIIAGSHFVIDRFRLARYICWAKNFIAPLHIESKDGVWLRNYPWKECSDTGYYKERPAWMSVWLMIIADNTLHLLCNDLALRYLGS